MTPTPEDTLAELAIRFPAATRVFHRLSMVLENRLILAA